MNLLSVFFETLGSGFNREDSTLKFSTEYILRCSSADIISIHTPLNVKTKNMIKKEQLLLMKEDTIIINTAINLKP